tara:strand:- start:1437 stop:1673 length:237 start_codon:yes stop_codon:yes gene_type:complete
MSTKWRFRLLRSFFGLTSDYTKEIYEQMFFMNYTGNWSITELYNLPVGLRNWFIERTVKQKEKENKAMEKLSQKTTPK